MHEFLTRQIGPKNEDVAQMLKEIGVGSLDKLIDQVIPQNIRASKLAKTNIALSEHECLEWLKKVSSQNSVFRSFIGQGFYNTFMPSVIARNIYENPGWYTQYTPYQPEISQGRLELLLVFQTMISEICNLEIANSSLLDEASAAAEAMQMSYRIVNKNSPVIRNNFFVDQNCFKTTIDVLETRANQLGINLLHGCYKTFAPDATFFGGLIQSPNKKGFICNIDSFCKKLKDINALSVVGTDLLCCTIFNPPGFYEADVVYGNSQRFGVPLNYGGPHAAFFATSKNYIREIPGRIVGVTIDQKGNQAYRLTLQTREQHIKRDKATSNICTAQTLLALLAAAYACYHGREGLISIAERLHSQALWLREALAKGGYNINLEYDIFDTINIRFNSDSEALDIINKALDHKINFFLLESNEINISLDETLIEDDLINICKIFNLPIDINTDFLHKLENKDIYRQDKFLDQSVFKDYHSETEMLRYLKRLENKDLSLAHAMIPLGSCTMKLNPCTAMLPLSFTTIKDIHPFAPNDQTLGYQTIFSNLAEELLNITGFAGISLQPNSGSQGEFAGLLTIKSYFQSVGQEQRDIVLIPKSAHGTNPASASMCGLKVVIVECDQNGNIDLEDIKAKVALHANNLFGAMITYPSTHGIFEDDILKITEVIHQAGGQIYLDGANMNAQIGLTTPKILNCDVCHINLHKTFAIPHGGGGPGAGPILVAPHLVNFLPKHYFNSPDKNAKNSVTATPFGNAAVLVISLAYIKMLGTFGYTMATKIAILNANYILSRIKEHIPILYTNQNKRVGHELILDVRNFKKIADIDVADISKRLIDYSFHPPTVSFPVTGTLMIEPTESESKKELDRFCDALINIKKEIMNIAGDQNLRKINILKEAPHTTEDLVDMNWNLPYSKREAVFPLDTIPSAKFWPTVKRINEVFGDKNLICRL